MSPNKTFTGDKLPDQALDHLPLLGSIEFENSTIDVRVARTLAELRSLEREWTNLETRDGGRFKYFQSFDWCVNWAAFRRADTSEGELYVLVALKGNDVISIWPLMQDSAPLGIRKIVSLTFPAGQYTNLLCDGKHFPAQLGQKMLKLVKSSGEADCICLDLHPKNSVMARIFAPFGAETPETRAAAMYDLKRYPSSEELHASLPKNLRKNRNKRRNALARLGEVKLDVHPAGTPQYAKAVETALGMKQAWLEARGHRTSFVEDKTNNEFLASLTSRKDDQGRIEGAFAFELLLDDQPIALEISFAERGHIYSFLGAFDWNMRGNSPGKIQIEAAVGWAIDNGYDYYDFLGEPADYKHYWSDTSTELAGRNVPLTLKGRLYCGVWLHMLRPLSYRALDALSPAWRGRLVALLDSRKPKTDGSAA